MYIALGGKAPLYDCNINLDLCYYLPVEMGLLGLIELQLMTPGSLRILLAKSVDA